MLIRNPNYTLQVAVAYATNALIRYFTENVVLFSSRNTNKITRKLENLSLITNGRLYQVEKYLITISGSLI